MNTLASISATQCECISVEGDTDAQVRLKRMGICSGRTITVVHSGDPMVLNVVEARLGVSRRLADCVQVKQASSDA